MKKKASRFKRRPSQKIKHQSNLLDVEDFNFLRRVPFEVKAQSFMPFLYSATASQLAKSLNDLIILKFDFFCFF